ncbi:MAG: hypothetical protein CMF96_11295 [Candidatus Marinimicrobia bacterium]|nr:hypothetical protein [Candidatus Neomarinimicrobiota bacterium]|tara:strand:+ start:1627 stop:2310 length:684 start_codon:yes stop_codon:yes gene_type:complete
MLKKAIIIGGTGATGSQLVKKILLSDNWGKVTTIGRKPVLNGRKHAKLNDIVLDNFKSLDTTKGLWAGHDVFFNCIGTTIKKVENPKEFKNVEVGISEIAAKLASEEKVKNASIISASGANKNQWSKDWIHPLFYLKIMGQKEQTVLTKRFESTSIFRPGMLVRLSNNQQSIIDIFLTKSGLGLPVDSLASAMIYNQEILNSHKDFIINKSNTFTGNKVIKAILKKR